MLNDRRELVNQHVRHDAAPQPGGVRRTPVLDGNLRYGALALPALGAIITRLLSATAASEAGGRVHGVSEGWQFVVEPLELSLGWHAAVGAIWLAALALPAGALAPFSFPRLAVWFAAAAGGVLAATFLTPAAELKPVEVGVLMAGFMCGVAIRRAAAAGRLVPVLTILCAAAFVLLLTLVPREGSPPLSAPRLSLVGGRRGGADALANIALFVPLGMALAAAKLRLWQAVAAAALLSLCVETAQYWIPGRAPAVGDVAMNTLGGLAGGLLLLPASAIWRRRTPLALTLLASSVAPAIIAGTGWLLTPVVGEGEYRVQWAAPRRNMEAYSGRLTAVRIGEHALRPGTNPGLAALFRDGLLDGTPLVIEGTAGQAPNRPSPLLRVVVRGGEPLRARETLALIAYRDDALLRVGQRAREFRLFEQYYRFPRAFAPITPGEPLAVEVRREGRAWRLRVGTNASSRVAFGVGDGWALLVSSSTLPAGARVALSCVWLLLLAVPAGLVAPRNFWPALLHATGMAATIGIAVWMPGALVVRGWEAGFLSAAYLCAFAVACTARVPRPSRPSRAVDAGSGHVEAGIV